MRSLASYGFIIGCAGLAQNTLAQTVASAANAPAAEVADDIKNIAAAHRVVEDTTTALVALIDHANTYIEEDEPRFYTELGILLKGYVDFNAFARGVMGKYASASRIASLPPEQQRALKAQAKRFATIFTDSLINTYGRGLLVFDGERIEVLAPNKEAEARAAQGKAVVKQLIHGDRDQPYEIYYSLRRNSDNEWKIRNMIIESSNLGKIYRNQFDNAYKVYEGDIDKVIDNWAVSSEADQSEEQSEQADAIKPA
jgi:phospholipid transport system substrate-binding protein